jgi:hypothetical protein
MWEYNWYNDSCQIKEQRKHLNTSGKYHIYKMSKDELHMNDVFIDVYNPIFEALQELNTR